ncbi:MAG: DUF4252 domain-containing protein [Flavobacteriaceae bacterium]|nr:DUF4252 domain-containing protein [Flavobacteriaceae bacterium]MCY4266561.1 DUF4252 domain-containing protein [Flavobacteriaceae bacterium]MCY4300006.1 DUF4252 domain-containing protein [Flavobacteriaceae bacterium]
MNPTRISLKFGVLFIVFYLAGCQNFDKPTLQKYFVEKMDDPEFMVIDVPLVSFEDYFEDAEIKQLDVVKTIKKLNILLFLPRESIPSKTKSERNQVNEILKTQDYESLVSIASGDINVRLMVDCKEDKINEALIQFHQENVVFGLVRVLGKNIKAEKIIPLFAELNSKAFNDTLGDSLNEDTENVLSNLIEAFKHDRKMD